MYLIKDCTGYSSSYQSELSPPLGVLDSLVNDAHGAVELLHPLAPEFRTVVYEQLLSNCYLSYRSELYVAMRVHNDLQIRKRARQMINVSCDISKLVGVYYASLVPQIEQIARDLLSILFLWMSECWIILSVTLALIQEEQSVLGYAYICVNSSTSTHDRFGYIVRLVFLDCKSLY